MKNGGQVLVFSEREEVALELLSVGRALADACGGGLTAIVVGSDSSAAGPDRSAAARDRIARGADAARLLDDIPGAWNSDLHVAALEQAVAGEGAIAVLIGDTAQGVEVAARLAQRLGVGCASDCTDLAFRDGELVIERRSLGRFLCRQIIKTRPAVVTVQPRRFPVPDPVEGRLGRIDALRVDLPPSRLRVVDRREREGIAIRIDRADIVVGVGRGLRAQGDLSMIEDLAHALGGVVGASRPLTDDLQWLPAEVKIGLSGVSVRPQLYIACGISGQIEHNVGMRESGTIVAINSDPNAPIMEQADYRVTADLYELIPALTRAVRDISGLED